MDEKTLRLLDKVTDKLATKIADRLVDKLGLRLADRIAERMVERQRWASMTKDERIDEWIHEAGYTRDANGQWVSPPKRERKPRAKRNDSSG